MSDKIDKDFDASDWKEAADMESDEEIEYEELDFEEQPQVGRRADDEEDWEEDWEDEPQPMRPIIMVLVFFGLILLAALICAGLWHITHGNKDVGGQTSRPTVILADVAESTFEATTEPTLEPVAEPAESPEGMTIPEATATPEVIATPEATATPEVTATPETTAKPEITATPVPTVAPETVQTPEATENASVQEPVSGNETMAFTEVQETVTAKDVINLRSLPSTADAENIVTQAQNGETLSRTGINNDTGWSRIDYNGQTLYAVSQYLTTDLSYQPPVPTNNPNRVSTKDGRVIIFTDCDDNISPKEYVNLRLEPSTSEGDSTVHCQLNYGETAHRTGYSPDSGWSRVEYDGKVLYVVTSMVYVVTE